MPPVNYYKMDGFTIYGYGLGFECLFDTSIKYHQSAIPHLF